MALHLKNLKLHLTKFGGGTKSPQGNHNDLFLKFYAKFKWLKCFTPGLGKPCDIILKGKALKQQSNLTF